MLKDRFVEASRSPDCAYAIDCKDGGRLLSPLQAPKWINFFQRNRTWTGLKQKFIDLGINDWTFEVNLLRKAETEYNYVLVSVSSSNGLTITSTSVGDIGIHLQSVLGTSGVWSGVSANITSNNPNASVLIPAAQYPVNIPIAIKIVKIGNVADIYINSALSATYTGTATAITNPAGCRSNFDGNIFSASLKNADGTVLWQAYPADLYEMWRPVPVPGSKATGTWEVRNGLIKPSATATFADGRLTAGVIDTPVDLRGYTGSFSLFWRGSIAKGFAVVQQGNASMEGGIYFYINSIGMLSMAIGNGTTGVSASGAVPDGYHALTMTVDPTARSIKAYVDGVLIATATIPVNFGAINPNAILTALRLFKGTEAFAFYDRALTDEEISVLSIS